MENSKRILVADANADFRSFLVMGLQQQPDIEVVGTADDGYDAVESIVSLEPDTVLLDIVLPKLDGLGVMRAVNGMALSKKPNFIVISSFVTDLLEIHAAALGAQYFVVKPFEVSTLLEMMRFVAPGPAPDQQDEDVKSQITRLLHDIGIPSHIKGYYYIREAIMIAMRDRENIGAITKLLYPNIAKTYSTTPTRVERAIRHAIEVAWDRGDIDTQNELFRNTVSSERGKPTNSEFIATISDNLQLQTKGNMMRI